jgi:hypothetical protein
MVKSKFAPIILLLTIILFFPVWVQAGPGKPFQQLQAQIDALKAENALQNGYISTLQAKVAALEAIFAGVSRADDTILFTGVNLQIVNGLGETDGVEDGEFTIDGDVNGLGNLIVGYNEARDVASDKTGSHNLIIGVQHNYSNFGGLVAGGRNNISGPLSSVIGGFNNTASALSSSVCGGDSNEASAEVSSVSGGFGNTASGVTSSVCGGDSNEASGNGSSVSGGFRNTASGLKSSVSGGESRSATDTTNWAAGGLSEPN